MYVGSRRQSAQLAIKFETQIMLFRAQEVKSGYVFRAAARSRGPTLGHTVMVSSERKLMIFSIWYHWSITYKLDLSSIFQPDNLSVLDKLDFLSDTYLVLR